MTVIALTAGAAAMQHLDRQMPHAHVEQIEPGTTVQPQVGLVVAAIALHNLPEGLAVGVAAAAGADHGMSLGIALQNIPEGWIVASAMLALGAPPVRAALMALATGLVEPVGGLRRHGQHAAGRRRPGAAGARCGGRCHALGRHP